MKYKIRSFQVIMRVELQDLKEDIEDLLDNNRKKFQEQKISQRVYMENEALYQNELIGIEEFSELLLSKNPSEFKDLSEFIQTLKEEFYILLKKEEIALAVKVCIDRKLLKVSEYVNR
ncbi:MAG: hypothetical protein R6V04_00600 [bacterium]